MPFVGLSQALTFVIGKQTGKHVCDGMRDFNNLILFTLAVEKTVWSGPAHAVRRHGCPLMPPHNMIPSPNVCKYISFYVTIK